MNKNYKIRLARREELPFLPEVEVRAARAFPDNVLPRWMWGKTLEPRELEKAYQNLSLWVAERKGELLGFAMALPLRDIALLYEVNVATEEMHRSIGTALLEAVADRATEKGHKKLWVSTFGNIPWAMAFFMRSGFKQVPAKELPDTMRLYMREESRNGLKNRVALALDLTSRPTARKVTRPEAEARPR